MNRPVALVCYICGREFGTKSLAIHIKSCQKKWQNEQNLKPPKQRRPCPQPPQGLDSMLGKSEITRKDIQKLNSGAFNTFVQQALIQCQFCGRRFNPTSLKPHQKMCQKSPMIRKPYVPANTNPVEQQAIKVPGKGYNLNPSDAAYQQYEQPQGNLEECYKCGRKFAEDRIGKHQKVCKGEGIKVAKKEEKPAVNVKNNQSKSNGGKDPKWKVQHEQFQNAIKYMRQMKAVQAKGGKITDLPPPPKGNYDHYVECKYCGRKYAPDVAERHIPKCQNIINKPGGIKPSQIQQKYVQGTGAQSSKPVVVEPRSQIINGGYGTQASKVQGYSNNPANNPFGQQQQQQPRSNSQFGGASNPNSTAYRGANVKAQSPMTKPKQPGPMISQIDPRQSNGYGSGVKPTDMRQSNGFNSSVKPQSPFKTAGKMMTSNQQYGQGYRKF